jgi:hypothetical protein
MCQQDACAFPRIAQLEGELCEMGECCGAQRLDGHVIKVMFQLQPLAFRRIAIMIASHTGNTLVNDALDHFIAPRSKVNKVASAYNQINLLTPKNSQRPYKFHQARMNIRDDSNLH